MPRSMQEILDHADELAARFEDYEPAEGDRKDATALRALRAAVLTQAEAERAVAAAVATARQAGHSWSSIGGMLGTSGEAARQRYSGDRNGAKVVPLGNVHQTVQGNARTVKAAKAPAAKTTKRVTSASAARKSSSKSGTASRKPARPKA